MNFNSISDPRVREYMMKRRQNEQALADAQGGQDMAGYAGVGAQLLNDYNKSQRRDVILQNRLQDIGRGPNVVRGETSEVDPNIASRLADIGVSRAKDKMAREKTEFGEDQQLADIDMRTKAKDPQSEQSKQAREFMKYLAPSLGNIPGFDQMSAERLEKISPALMQKYRADKDAEATRNRLDIQRQIAERGYQDKLEQRQEKQAKEKESQVQKFSKDISGVQDVNNSVGAVEKVLGFNLDSYDPTTKTVDGKSLPDLPGVSIPGIGRVSMYSSDARALEGAIAKVFNTELKDRSGAAVTTPEMERLKIEFQSGKFNTEEEMIAAMKRYKDVARQEMMNREAAYPEDIKELYRSRGGQTSSKASTMPSPSTSGSLRASDLPD